MQTQFVFRHMESSDALRTYAEERLSKIKRYFSDPLKVSCTFSVEKIHHHAAFDVTLRNGLALHSAEKTENMYSSIDMALAKMERQVRRYKDRIKDHKPQRGRAAKIRQAIISADAFDYSDPIPSTESRQDSAPIEVPEPGSGFAVVREKEFHADSMDVKQAAMQMDLLHKSFYVFTNSETGDINVIYRDDDGNYGLIETRGHVSD
jgi:putative sigma-54 modulation protein